MTAFLQFCVNTLGYLRLMTVSDLIDIAILSFVFYKCIGIFQRTNAAKVAKALLIIVVAMWISYQFNLNAINFILSKAVELGLLALVVIFQPEIRRFLEKVGSNSVSGFSRYFRSEAPVTDLEQAIAETVEAYAELSKSKIGALMVFERETDLSHIIASGPPFQSTVTSELLKNLFYPKAPLHDGAVVVRRGKIVAAACMLPMSESMNLSKDLGMRHRAGIGMSEHSDAVVAIVSEETGEPVTESTSAKMGTVEALRMTFASGRNFWPLAIWFFFMYGTIMLWQASQAGSFYKSVYGFSAGDAGIMVTMVGVGMVCGCPIAGRLSDRYFHSRKKVILIGTLVYTCLWGVIWATAGKGYMDGIATQGVINFLFGFFGGFFVVAYAQIKELYPIAMAGTSTAALNLFPFAGGAILITIAGFMISDKTLAEFQNVWLMAFLMMVAACVCAFLSVEKGSDEKVWPLLEEED